MAEVLSTLTIFTKIMKEMKEMKENRRRIGVLVPSIHPFFLADYGIEINTSTGFKQLGEDLENAFQRLNALTNETNLIKSCICSFIQKNQETRTWSEKEKEFVSNALSKQANGK